MALAAGGIIAAEDQTRLKLSIAVFRASFHSESLLAALTVTASPSSNDEAGQGGLEGEELATQSMKRQRLNHDEAQSGQVTLATGPIGILRGVESLRWDLIHTASAVVRFTTRVLEDLVRRTASGLVNL